MGWDWIGQNSSRVPRTVTQQHAALAIAHSLARLLSRSHMLSSLRASFLYHRASSRLLIAARASLALQHSASLATRPGAARRPTRPSPPPTPPPSPEPQRASLPACTSGRPRAAVPSPASSLAQPRALSAESCRSSLVNRPGHFPYRVLGYVRLPAHRCCGARMLILIARQARDPIGRGRCI